MPDGLRKSHLRKSHQVGLSEVGLPEDYQKEYHGENDKLVRTSAAPSSKQSNVNFVSVDLFNEYLASIFGNSQEGKSIDAFVNNNMLSIVMKEVKLV